jgi:hypothetical protein
MEAISYITGWVSWLLIIIPVAAGTTITYYALKKSLSNDPEDIGQCDVRIRQTIKGAIIGMTISGLITAIRTFYS